MAQNKIDPDSFDKVNFVIDSWSHHCDAPAVFYIETLKPAALAAFITLITFGWDDVLRGAARPPGLGKRRWDKGKGRARKGVGRFPELGEEVGRRFPGADWLKETKWGTLGKFIWRLDMLGQQIAFYWLIAEITEDFFFDWTSLLYKTRWCQDSHLGRFSYEKIGYQTHPGFTWDTVNLPVKEYQEGAPQWAGLRGSTGAKECTVTAALNIRRLGVFPIPTSFGCRVVKRTGSFVFAQTGPHPTDQDGDLSVVVSGRVPANTEFRVQVYSEPNFADHGDGFVMALEVEDQ